MNQVSTIFPIHIRSEYQRGQAFGAFRSEAQQAAAAARAEFQAVGQAVDQALARPRNAAAALDLGVDELREAASAQQARAIAAREVADATLRAAQADGNFNTEMRQGVVAARQYAKAQDELSNELAQQLSIQERVQAELDQTASATDRVVDATRRGTTANQSMINSQRAVRTAGLQAGQQLTDVAVQLENGTRATTIFTQQVPQLAFALSGLERSGNAVQQRIGSFATFLAGPYGAAFFVATAVMGPFIAELIGVGEAAEDAEKSIEDQVEALRKQERETRNSEAAQSAFAQTLVGLNALMRETNELIQENSQYQQTAGERALERAQKEQALATVLLFKNTQELLQSQRDLETTLATTNPEQDNFVALRIQRQIDDIEQAEQKLLAAATALNASQDAINEARALRFTEFGLEGPEGEINRRYDQLIDREQKLAVANGEVNEGLSERVARLDAQRQSELDALSAQQRNSRGSRGLTEEQRALRDTQRFIESLEREIDTIGLSREELRAYEIDKAAAAAAAEGFFDEAERIRQLGADRETRFNDEEDVQRQEQITNSINEMLALSREQAQVDALLLAGRETEARILVEINRLQQDGTELSKEQANSVADIITADERRLEIMRDLQREQDLYLNATQDVRGEIEAIFAGRGDFSNFGQIFRDLNARFLTDQIFGDALEGLDDSVKAQFGRAVDDLELDTDRAGTAAEIFADTLIEQSRRIADPSYLPTFSSLNDNANTIFATAPRASNDNDRRGINALTPEEYYRRMANAVAGPIIGSLEEVLGPQLAANLEGVLGSTLYGLGTAGPVGGVLGFASGLNERFGEGLFSEKLFDQLSTDLSDALGGAQAGSLIAGIGDSIGLELSNTGAQIGGAIGSVLPIPGGQIIGSIAGGIFGNLIGGADRGSAIISNGRVSGFYGDTDEFKQQSGQLAESLLDAIDTIADQLDIEVNDAVGRVSIGIRDGDFRVDPQGRGFTKLSTGVLDFGQDSEAAVQAALQDLINDGIFGALEAAELRLLRDGPDIDAALQDVLDFRSVFDRLAERRDPVGFAIDQLNDEFEELQDIFDRAGATAEQLADLEELYWLERADIVEQATENSLSQLQTLLDDLTINNPALSLRDRQQLAIAEFDPLAARVAAGDADAFDEFSEVARQLLEIEREIFGSQEGYFSRLDQITALTQTALDNASGNTDDFSDRASPFDTPDGFNPDVGVRDSIDRLTDNIAGGTNTLLDAINDNIIALTQVTLAQARSRGGSNLLDGLTGT